MESLLISKFGGGWFAFHGSSLSWLASFYYGNAIIKAFEPYVRTVFQTSVSSSMRSRHRIAASDSARAKACVVVNSSDWAMISLRM